MGYEHQSQRENEKYKVCRWGRGASGAAASGPNVSWVTRTFCRRTSTVHYPLTSGKNSLKRLQRQSKTLRAGLRAKKKWSLVGMAAGSPWRPRPPTTPCSLTPSRSCINRSKPTPWSLPRSSTSGTTMTTASSTKRSLWSGCGPSATAPTRTPRASYSAAWTWTALAGLTFAR